MPVRRDDRRRDRRAVLRFVLYREKTCSKAVPHAATVAAHRIRHLFSHRLFLALFSVIPVNISFRFYQIVPQSRRAEKKEGRRHPSKPCFLLADKRPQNAALEIAARLSASSNRSRRWKRSSRRSPRSRFWKLVATLADRICSKLAVAPALIHARGHRVIAFRMIRSVLVMV